MLRTVADRWQLEDLRRTLGSHPAQHREAGERAAVAVVLLPAEDDTLVLLIRRAEHPLDPWSGHMALPGGRREPSDASDLAAAIRETREEVGLSLDKTGEFLGALDDLSATARGKALDLVISPFVFALGEVPALAPNPEVVEALWAPLGPMYDGRAAAAIPVELPSGPRRLPAWQVGPHLVWGLTYRMLAGLFTILGPPR